MRTPEEIKKGLQYCVPRYANGRLWIHCKEECPYTVEREGCRGVLSMDTQTYIQQLESNDSQVKKALSDNGFSSLEAFLQAYNQVKAERDALLHDLWEAEKTDCDCSHCRHYARLENEKLCEESDFMCPVCEKECRCKTCTEDLNHYEWRGVCAENDGGETHES